MLPFPEGDKDDRLTDGDMSRNNNKYLQEATQDEVASFLGTRLRKKW